MIAERSLLRLVAFAVAVGSAFCGENGPRRPMAVRYENTATYRWLNKEVLETRLLDEMEDVSTWELRGKGEMTLTTERAKDGSHSLRLRARASGDEQSPARGRVIGSARVTRRFAGEDWTHFNRISVWIYPSLPGFYNIPLAMILQNDGAVKVPDVYGREGLNYVNLENNKWNHVVWEIASLDRDKVTGVSLQYTLAGHEPEAEPVVMFDFDHLELQRVDADHCEGWNVAPGRISFSHTGYSIGSSNTAIASDLKADSFQLVRVDSGEVVLSKAVHTAKTPIGQFQVMDFSDVGRPGVYRIRAGGVSTEPFRIDADVWRETTLKVLNFFYAERCGMEIPGVHRACHRDWQGVHGDKRIIINGGWHDAGDLSQGPVNTGEAVYAMLSLAEKLELRGADPDLRARLLDEAKWGLDWVLKTSFGDGYRIGFAALSNWTNGIIGDFDDATARAQNAPFENLLAAAAEALAARVLKRDDPALAAYSLKKAREDWRFGTAALGAPDRTTSQSRGGLIDLVAAGALASLDLFRATGEQQYGDKAVELGNSLVQFQQRSFHPGLKIPVAGFFYTSAEKNRILHYEHRGHEQMPLVALAGLCDVFPEHKDWMKWYSAVTLYSEYYLKATGQYTQPYGVLPASIYKDDEYTQAPENLRESYRRQVLNGIEVGKGYCLRLFPVWSSRRGHFGTMLSQTKGLAAAAQLRGRLDLASLAHQQLQWVVGRNPFVQSTMYGEGYDYAPQYSEMSGDMVGSLPVGIQTRADNDLPYWPPGSCYNYKEVWVHPAARWIFIMRDLAGPAWISGQAEAGYGQAIVFREAVTGEVLETNPDPATGVFHATLPAGRYAVRAGIQTKTLTVLPGGDYTVDLRPGHDLDLTLAKETRTDGEVTLRLVAQGSGHHHLSVRTDNLTLSEPERDLDLVAGRPQTIVLRGRTIQTDSPWVAIIVPDAAVAQRYELTGSTRDH